MVVNPLIVSLGGDSEDVSLEDEEEDEAAAGVLQIGKTAKTDRSTARWRDSAWVVPAVGALTACVILIVVASAIEAIDDPKDSWRTELPAGRNYDG